MSILETARDEKRQLRRVLGFWALVAFGVGDILGAGIYVLIGEIAGIAGHASWIAFGVALVVAGLTALSYAELGSRFPKSGGEAHFCQQGLGSPGLALMTGWLVLCSGIVSMATVARAFAGYALALFEISAPVALIAMAVAFLMGTAAINVWGIRQTSRLNIVLTIVEVTGLIIVLVTGLLFLAGPGNGTPIEVPDTPGAVQGVGWSAIFQAGALAFFAFIGFEDMVNVAEEVKNPKRNMPRAILVAVAVAGLVYMLVIAVATRVVPPQELSASQAPLLEVVTRAAPRIPAWLFAAIALFAVGNTGLLNFVTASRLLYGMAGQKLVPGWFGTLHAKYGTPHRSTAVVLVVAIVLAASGTVSFLAGTTSVLILAVFFVVNISLLSAKTFRRVHVPEHDGFKVHALVPLIAAITCLVLAAFVPGDSMLRALVLVGIGLVLMVIRHRTLKD